jgi:hypothetical protein
VRYLRGRGLRERILRRLGAADLYERLNALEQERSQLRNELDRRAEGGVDMVTLFDVARQVYSGDVGTKHPYYYQRYDEFFRHHNFVPTGILEIGVHKGESTKVFATAYPSAKIVAIDLVTYDHADFSAFPNVTYLRADQTNRQRLEEVTDREFPSGFNLVVDDASHIGAYTHIAFHTVFPRMMAGGIYIIEDWGTGYWDDFPDGGRFQEYPFNLHEGNIPRRMLSHDFGMVGFVKSLVDMTSEPDIRLKQSDPPVRKSRIEKLEISEAICIALKARTEG